MFIYFLLTAGHFKKNNKVNTKKNSSDSKIEKKKLAAFGIMDVKANIDFIVWSRQLPSWLFHVVFTLFN